MIGFSGTSGYYSGQPVATPCRFYTRGVTHINFVSTLPAARRRGVGTAMTALPLLTAWDDGYHVAVHYPTAMGHHLSHRSGFTASCTIVSYSYPSAEAYARHADPVIDREQEAGSCVR